MQKSVKAYIYRGESMFVAECVGINVVTQGATIEETLQNLQEAVALHLENEDPAEYGLEPTPSILVTLELDHEDVVSA